MKKMLYGVLALVASVQLGYAMEADIPRRMPTTGTEAAIYSLRDMEKELKQANPNLFFYFTIAGRRYLANIIAQMEGVSVDGLKSAAYYDKWLKSFYQQHDLGRYQALIDRWRGTYLTLISILYNENPMNPRAWQVGLDGTMRIGAKEYFEGELVTTNT